MNSSVIIIIYLIWILGLVGCKINAASHPKLLINKHITLKSSIAAGLFVSLEKYNSRGVITNEKERYKLNIIGLLCYILWFLTFILITVFIFVLPQAKIAPNVVVFSESPLQITTINNRVSLYGCIAFFTFTISLYFLNHFKMVKKTVSKVIFISLSVLFFTATAVLLLFAMGII